MAKSITLLIPGLLDNLPDPVPRLPALETLLARGNYRSDIPAGYERTLMHLFGLPQSSEQDVPEGALSRYAQTGEKPEGVWLCAAPVHLFADQSRVYLNTIDKTALSEEEAAQIINELNKVYREDGWEFVQHTSTHWYLHIQDMPAIRTTPLREVDGKAIHDKLPQGVDALQWHRVLNEMQMLLHSSPINSARHERGEIAVNGVWLWGSGVLPDALATRQWQGLYSNEPIAMGLALLSDVVAHDVSMDISQFLAENNHGNYLIVTSPNIASDMSANLVRMEENWFSPLYRVMQNGKIDDVTISAGDDRQWSVSRRNLLRFWKRNYPLHNYKKSS